MAKGWTAASFEKHLRTHPDVRALDTGKQQEPLGPVILVLPWPPSGNHRLQPVIAYRAGGQPYAKHILRADMRAYHKRAEQAIALQHRGYAPLTGSLHAIWELHHPDQTARDLDNVLKDIPDCCTRMRVFLDDSQIDKISIDRIRQTDRLYVKLTIMKLAPWG